MTTGDNGNVYARTLLDFAPAAPPPTPIELGVAAADACADAAESRGWDKDAAAAFVLRYLADRGPTAGEVLVTEASKLYPPHDGRAFGSVFLKLSRSGKIEKCGHGTRAKGHGTSGAIIWRLSEPRRAA